MPWPICAVRWPSSGGWPGRRTREPRQPTRRRIVLDDSLADGFAERFIDSADLALDGLAIA